MLLTFFQSPIPGTTSIISFWLFLIKSDIILTSSNFNVQLLSIFINKTASTFLSFITLVRQYSNLDPSASAIISKGFKTEIIGYFFFIISTVLFSSSANSNSEPSNMSAANIEGPPTFEIIATLLPLTSLFKDKKYDV